MPTCSSTWATWTVSVFLFAASVARMPIFFRPDFAGSLAVLNRLFVNSPGHVYAVALFTDGSHVASVNVAGSGVSPWAPAYGGRSPANSVSIQRVCTPK